MLHVHSFWSLFVAVVHTLSVCMLCRLHTCTFDASFPLIQLSFGQYDFFWSLASIMLTAAAGIASHLHSLPRPSHAGRAACFSSRSRSHFLLTSVESSAMKAKNKKNML